MRGVTGAFFSVAVLSYPMADEERFRLPPFVTLTQDELIKLAVCLFLDIVEYILPLLMVPLVGDFIDIGGLVLSFYMFGWVGGIVLLELLPGGDLLPMYLIAWVAWYALKRTGQRPKDAKYR